MDDPSTTVCQGLTLVTQDNNNNNNIIITFLMGISMLIYQFIIGLSFGSSVNPMLPCPNSRRNRNTLLFYGDYRLGLGT